MRVTVQHDNGKEEVFQHITDLYICYRQTQSMTDGDAQYMSLVPVMRSHSWGAGIRELVKELQQSLVELQDFLRELRNGGPKQHRGGVALDGGEHPERMDKGDGTR